MTTFTESLVEDAALTWLTGLGWTTAHGPDIAPDRPRADRRDCGEIAFAQRLHQAFLPLISGEVRVKDAAEFIGRAV